MDEPSASFPRYSWPVLSSTVMIWPSDSCKSLTGTPRPLIVVDGWRRFSRPRECLVWVKHKKISSLPPGGEASSVVKVFSL